MPARLNWALCAESREAAAKVSTRSSTGEALGPGSFRLLAEFASLQTEDPHLSPAVGWRPPPGPSVHQQLPARSPPHGGARTSVLSPHLLGRVSQTVTKSQVPPTLRGETIQGATPGGQHAALLKLCLTSPASCYCVEGKLYIKSLVKEMARSGVSERRPWSEVPRVQILAPRSPSHKGGTLGKLLCLPCAEFFSHETGIVIAVTLRAAGKRRSGNARNSFRSVPGT